MALDQLILTRFFVALLALLFCAYFFGSIFTWLRMPRVVGEIFGGCLCGPTFFGYFFHEQYVKLFESTAGFLDIIYWMGLIFLMFTSGFEIQKGFDRRDKKIISALVAGTTLIPLIFGWISTHFFSLEKLIGSANNILALKLVITVAIAITSIPVISKIFIDLGIINTSFARIVLATATIHDLVLWAFIAVATGLVSAQVISVQGIFTHVLLTVLFFLIVLMLMPRLLHLKIVDQNLLSRMNESVLLSLILLVFVVISSWLDVNLVFGAFLAGIGINNINNTKIERAKIYFKNFSLSFFVPIYFAMVGLKLDLIHHFNPVFFIIFVLFAIVVQTIAVLLTARLLKYNWLSSFNFAVVLNDRGGPCIVLATLAFDLGIISENFFVTLVLLAVVTSLTAGAWLDFILKKKWPLLDK